MVSRSGAPLVREVLQSFGDAQTRQSLGVRRQRVMLVRVQAWNLMRHGCRIRACMDVCAAYPAPARVQAPSDDRSIRTKPVDVVVRGVDACAAPHPVSGHFVNPSMQFRRRRPFRQNATGPRQRPSRNSPCTLAGAGLAYFSFASARSASARSVFSHENAVALCCAPVASV